MPGSILNADISFPHFTGNESTENKIDAIQNYLYMLYEQLRYSMGNLGTENFSEGGIKELEKIVAKNIDLTGFVTFNSLSEPGQTVINGANISTGTISADRLSLTGAITFGDLNSDLQSTINSKASGADVYTIITSTLVSSPNIAGAKYHDIGFNSTLDITSFQGFTALLYGDNDVSSLADSAFGVASFAATHVGQMYLGGVNIMSAGGTTYSNRLGIKSNCTFEKELKLTYGYGYGSMDDRPNGTEGQIYFVI